MYNGTLVFTFILVADFAQVLRFFKEYQKAVRELGLNENDFYLADYDTKNRKISVEWADSTEEEEKEHFQEIFADIVQGEYVMECV